MYLFTRFVCSTDDALAQTFLHFDTSNGFPLLLLKDATLLKPNRNDTTACTASYANKTKLMDVQPVEAFPSDIVETGMQGFGQSTDLYPDD